MSFAKLMVYSLGVGFLTGVAWAKWQVPFFICLWLLLWFGSILWNMLKPQVEAVAKVNKDAGL